MSESRGVDHIPSKKEQVFQKKPSSLLLLFLAFSLVFYHQHREINSLQSLAPQERSASF